MFRVLRRGVPPFIAILALAALMCPEAIAKKRPQLADTATKISDRLMAFISVRDQRVSFYDANGASVHAPISSGQKGLETPSGVVAILEKDIDHHSNVYDDAAIPFMQRITWTGLALVRSAAHSEEASHPCSIFNSIVRPSSVHSVFETGKTELDFATSRRIVKQTQSCDGDPHK